jgi:Zinc finger, C2H2 type
MGEPVHHSFQSFPELISLSELSFRIFDPHSLKRKRSASNPDMEATLFLRHLYKAIEALHVRITILEEDTDESKLVEAFGGRMCSLEEMKDLLQKYPSPRTSATFRCRGVNCSRTYVRPDTLQKHIRESHGGRHRFVKKISEAGYCLQCDKHFNKRGKLGRHDFTVHREPSNSRIDSFSPFWGENLCKWDIYLPAIHSAVLI